MKGRTLFGLGSGWQGAEAEGLGIDKEYHASGRAAEDTLDVMQRLWKFRTGDPEYSFEVGGNRGVIKRRVMPAPYGKRHPVIIRTASREAGLLKAAQNGWPAFLGIFGGDVCGQARQYRAALAAANHPQEIVEECLRWCTADWLSVVVAPTDAEAKERAKEAWAERMDIRRRYIAIHGKTDGPVIRPKPGESQSEGYAKGGDMKEILAGSPDTVAARVQEMADIGINHLMVRFLGEWGGETRHICAASAELFAREIMPRFTGIPPLRDPLALDLDVVV
jgi:alkanesulfonate monooxygenase SsuD/methylene tetrahydromethanopterin reductase-like flavin-dependent oxidoreductase (luciferase family)